MEKKNLILNLLDEVKGQIEDQGLKDKIDYKRNKLGEDRFTIAVFGHFSNGKSTFLNALMGYGEEILKEDELASTAAITRLKYPEDKSLLGKAKVIFKNKDERIIPFEQLNEFSAKSSSGTFVEDKIEEVVAYFDSELLKNGVEIVDTPGFNSTYEKHTKTSEAYVKKSDASIFLFSFEKPGASKELEFLKYINNSLDRVFLVLNKIDLSNNTEASSSVENVVKNLREKLLKYEINVENKKIYPISAKLKKQAINEESEPKNNASRFEDFTNELAEYLTSDENTRDRLEAPINSIINEFKEYKNELNNKAEAYSSDKEQINNKIAEEKNILRDLEKQLKEKKKNIDNSVREIIRKNKNYIEDKKELLLSGIYEDLKELKSEFSISLYDFNDINEQLNRGRRNIWNDVKSDINENVIDVVDQVVDDNSSKEIKEKISNIINNGLNIGEVDLEEPKFNFEIINKLDNDIKILKDKYDSLKGKNNKFRDDKFKSESINDELADLKKEIYNLKEERNHRILSLGNGEKIKYQVTEKVKVERGSGFKDKIAQWWNGDKYEEIKVDKIDDFNYNHVRELKKEVEDEYSHDINEKDSQLKNAQEKILEYGDIDSKLEDSKAEKNEAFEEFRKAVQEKESKEIEQKQNIINTTKTQYKKKIAIELDEFVEETCEFLDNNKSYISKIMYESLDDDLKKIEASESKIENLDYANFSSKDGLEKEIKDIYVKIDNLNNKIEKLRSAKDN